MNLQSAYACLRQSGYTASVAFTMAGKRLFAAERAAAEYDNAAFDLAKFRASGGDCRRYAEPFATLSHAVDLARTNAANMRRGATPREDMGGACRQASGAIYAPASYFREVIKAESVLGNGRDGASGWISSDDGSYSKDGSGLIWGVVCRLTGKDGKARFVAGYVVGEDDSGVTFNPSEIFSEDAGGYECPISDMRAARDAARAGDGMAERAAETEAEYQRAWRAGVDFAELQDSERESRRELLALAAERRAARAMGGAAFPAICRTLAGRIEELAASIQESRVKRAELREAERFQPDAFQDGAGL